MDNPITTDTKGRPVFGETRIRVAWVLAEIQNGMSPEDVPSHFPPLTLADVQEALDWALEGTPGALSATS